MDIQVFNSGFFALQNESAARSVLSWGFFNQGAEDVEVIGFEFLISVLTGCSVSQEKLGVFDLTDSSEFRRSGIETTCPSQIESKVNPCVINAFVCAVNNSEFLYLL